MLKVKQGTTQRDLYWIFKTNREEKMKKIKHNDLTHYFLRDHKELPASYLASCKKFFYYLKVNNRNEVKKNEKN